MLPPRPVWIPKATRHFAALFMASVLASSTQVGAQESISDVNEAERIWATAWTSGDRKAYRELLADEFTWTYITGRVVDKEQAIDALRPLAVSEDTKTINEYGDTAVVYGVASLESGGRTITERFVRVWVKKETGRWQAVLFQATEIQ